MRAALSRTSIFHIPCHALRTAPAPLITLQAYSFLILSYAIQLSRTVESRQLLCRVYRTIFFQFNVQHPVDLSSSKPRTPANVFISSVTFPSSKLHQYGRGILRNLCHLQSSISPLLCFHVVWQSLQRTVNTFEALSPGCRT